MGSEKTIVVSQDLTTRKQKYMLGRSVLKQFACFKHKRGYIGVYLMTLGPFPPLPRQSTDTIASRGARVL
jgi:hypothetical protein